MTNKVLLCGKTKDGCVFFYRRDTRQYTSQHAAMTAELFEIGPGDSLRIVKGEGYLMCEEGKVDIAWGHPRPPGGPVGTLSHDHWCEVGEGDFITEAQ